MKKVVIKRMFTKALTEIRAAIPLVFIVYISISFLGYFATNYSNSNKNFVYIPEFKFGWFLILGIGFWLFIICFCYTLIDLIVSLLKNWYKEVEKEIELEQKYKNYDNEKEHRKRIRKSRLEEMGL